MRQKNSGTPCNVPPSLLLLPEEPPILRIAMQRFLPSSPLLSGACSKPLTGDRGTEVALEMFEGVQDGFGTKADAQQQKWVDGLSTRFHGDAVSDGNTCICAPTCWRCS